MIFYPSGIIDRIGNENKSGYAKFALKSFPIRWYDEVGTKGVFPWASSNKALVRSKYVRIWYFRRQT